MKGTIVFTEAVSMWDEAQQRYVTDWDNSTYYEYAGAVEALKGEGTSKQVMQQQLDLQKQAFNLMQAQQQKVSNSVGGYLSGNQGFDPAQLATMRAQFLNSMGTNYQQAGQNVRSALARRGSLTSDQPVGGDGIRGLSALEGGLASDTSSGLANIDLQNLQQALTNKFNAASLINGQAAQMTSPISSFGSGASNALNQYVQASNSGFGATFSRAFGGALGTGLGKGITGGLGSMATPGGTFMGGFNNSVGG